MSKIICDVCGTAYPETATQCPICGCAKSAADQAVTAQASGEDTSYVYTKGGRFSKRNVRRRTQKGVQESRSTAVRKSEAEDERTNVGLIVVVIVLLLAIIAVVVYIGIRFFAPFGEADKDPLGSMDSTGVSQTQQSTQAQQVPCTALDISNKTIEFRLSGDAWLLEAVPTPSNTTDKVTYTSSNEKVAIVSDVGCVTAVGGGEAVITVTCGSITQECKIICSFASVEIPTEDATADATIGATEDATTGPVDPDFVFAFNTKFVDESTGKFDTTIDAAGKTWRAYKKDMTVSPEDITWTSDDPTVATVENGIVTAVAPGKTEVHAQYGGETYTCIIRCSWKEVTPEETTGEEGDSEEETEAESADVTISHEDVTIKIGESFYLRLKDANGDNIEVQWEASESDYVTIDGNKITGAQAKLAGVTVSTTYEGTTYSCLVRISG